MNKFKLYQTAYGNDPYWREWYTNKKTGEYISLDTYDERMKKWENMSLFSLVYPESEVEKMRDSRSFLPWFQQIIIWSSEDAQAALLWWSCNYDNFREKLIVWDNVFRDLWNDCKLADSMYLAELFVRPDQQNQWLWSKLVHAYIESCREQWSRWILTRTTSLKQNPQQMFLNTWFQEVFDYWKTDPWRRKLFYLLLDA